MDHELQQLFDAIMNVTEFDRISGDLMPLPLSEANELNSMIVNCYVSSSRIPNDTKQLVYWCRRQTILAMHHVRNHSESNELKKVSVVIYQTDGSRRGERIFFTNVNWEHVDQLSQNDIHLAIEYEGSRADSIQAFLDRN